jgi:phosphate transport system substrate-binding protein
VNQTPGAIGYVELGYATINKMAYGQVRNSAMQFVAPTLEAVTAAAAGVLSKMGANTDFRVSLTNPDGAAAYPIATMTWLLVHKTYTNAAKAKALIQFIWWAETEGQAAAPSLGYAPLPQQLRPWIQARLKSITVDGRPVWTGSAAQ